MTSAKLPGDQLISLIGRQCEDVAARLDVIIRFIEMNGRDPERIGIEPCGMEEEIDLVAIRRQLSDVAGYLPANGQLYELPANPGPWVDDPWAPAAVERQDAPGWYAQELQFAQDAHEFTSDLDRAIYGGIFAETEGDLITDDQYARAAQLIACSRGNCDGEHTGHNHWEQDPRGIWVELTEAPF